MNIYETIYTHIIDEKEKKHFIWVTLVFFVKKL